VIRTSVEVVVDSPKTEGKKAPTAMPYEMMLTSEKNQSQRVDRRNWPKDRKVDDLPSFHTSEGKFSLRV